MEDEAEDEAEFPPDDPRHWLSYARGSLRLAEARVKGVPLAHLCFSAQMSAEQAIKAVMIARDVPYPRIHDVLKLLDILENAGFRVTSKVRKAAMAASFPPERRYPGETSLRAAEYRRRLEGARALIEWAAEEMAAGGGNTGGVHESRPRTYSWDHPWAGSGRPDPDLLRKLVTLIVPIARPDRIILFGSAARGTMHAQSDLDVLVIRSEPYDYDTLIHAIRDALLDLHFPVDVLLATPQELERYGNSWCLVYYPALREGRVIYEQAHGFIAEADSRSPAA